MGPVTEDFVPGDEEVRWTLWGDFFPTKRHCSLVTAPSPGGLGLFVMDRVVAVGLFLEGPALGKRVRELEACPGKLLHLLWSQGASREGQSPCFIGGVEEMRLKGPLEREVSWRCTRGTPALTSLHLRCLRCPRSLPRTWVGLGSAFLLFGGLSSRRGVGDGTGQSPAHVTSCLLGQREVSPGFRGEERGLNRGREEVGEKSLFRK